MGVIRKTWACLNRHCLHTFTSDAGDFPPCVRCGGIKVKWVPMPFAVRSQRTQDIDRTVSELKHTYGDKNYRTPVRGEPTAPRVNHAAGSRSQRYTPPGMAGWSADIPLDAAGNFTAHCAPTGVTAKVSVSQGQRASASRVTDPKTGRARTLGVGSMIEASHRPPGGIPK
jgi:hypothetical protein